VRGGPCHTPEYRSPAQPALPRGERSGKSRRHWRFPFGDVRERPGPGKDELAEAVTYPAFSAGWPNAMSAITQLKDIVEDQATGNE
jgi:hypothetical protein